MAESELNQDVARYLASALGEIRYGSIELTIHDSRVVQMERREKIRLGQPGHKAE